MIALRRPTVLGWLGLSWLVIIAQLLVKHWVDTGVTLSDTDDAMRLVELRAFLGGQGWFDLHESRIWSGYDPHWSRLIDGGLAGLFLVFKTVVDPALAERLTRVAWPLLWLVPAMASSAAMAWRLAGRDGALVALLLAAVGLPALMQFVPGRIDHHNVQIALALLALAAAVWSDRVRWAAWAAGVASALGLAVGFEALPFLVLAGAALALRFAIDRRGDVALADYGAALALGTALVFVASVGPARWSQTACDAMAINMLVPVVFGGTALWLARWPVIAETLMRRLALIAGAGAVAGLAFVALEPRCLGGPFAMMDREVWAVWLNHVDEMRPLLTLARSKPELAATLAAFPAAALVAAALLAREPATRRDFGFLTVAAALGLAAAMTVGSVKMVNYAMWFGMPMMALAAVRLSARLTLTRWVATACAGMMLAPAVIAAGAVAVVQAASPSSSPPDERNRRACFESASYAALAKLPPGLVAAEIDHGPFLLALTPHSVIAAPYHRLSAGILATHRLFAAPPNEARAAVDRLGAAYFAICAPHRPAGLADAQAETSLYGRLKAGDIPDWLEPLPGGPAFTVYRVKR